MGQLRPASADAGDAELRRRVGPAAPRVTSTGTSARRRIVVGDATVAGLGGRQGAEGAVGVGRTIGLSTKTRRRP